MSSHAEEGFLRLGVGSVLLILLILLFPLPLEAGACSHEIMGYYPSWTRWDPFLPADIDWSQVTTANHAFLEVLSDGTLAEDADYAFTRPRLIAAAHSGGAHAVPDRAGPLAVARTGAADGAVQVAWPGLATQAGGNTLYDLAGGLLPELGPGLPAAGCLSDDLPGTAYSDDRAGSFWYLIRGQNLCGQGPHGRPSLEATTWD